MTIVETILEQVNQIPPLSNASSKVMTLIGKDDVSAGSISEIVAHDASLAAQILRVSNSAAYKRREKIIRNNKNKFSEKFRGGDSLRKRDAQGKNYFDKCTND